MSTRDYHKCAKVTGECVGLKKGIKGYHKCARDSNCKKTDRAKVKTIADKIKTTTAKEKIKKVIRKKIIEKKQTKTSAFDTTDFINLLQLYINDYSQINMNMAMSSLFTDGKIDKDKVTKYVKKLDSRSAVIDKLRQQLSTNEDMQEEVKLNDGLNILKKYMTTGKTFQTRFKKAKLKHTEKLKK